MENQCWQQAWKQSIMINVDNSVYLLMISVDVNETKDWLGQYFNACRQQVYTYDASNLV